MKKVLLVLLAVTLFNCEPEAEQDLCEMEKRAVSVNNRVSTPTIDLGGMTSDLSLTPSDALNHQLNTTGDLNLNGFTLTIKNIQLTVTGNLNGGGTVKTQGAHGSICVIGAVQNNPNLSQANQNCTTLSNNDYDGWHSIGEDLCAKNGQVINGFEYRIKQ
jgi:hypothetical protein